MSKSFATKLAVAAALIAVAGSARAAGPITHIRVLFSQSNPTFTAGVTTNTASNVLFVNTFSSDSGGFGTPDGGQRVILQVVDNGKVIDNAISPAFFLTTGTGTIDGGNVSFPVTFFRAGTGLQFKAYVEADPSVTDENTFSVVAGSATKLVMVGPGMTYQPGTNPAVTTGVSGTFTPQEPNQPFTVRVIQTDNQFNEVSGTPLVTFPAVDQVTEPASASLVAGEKDFVFAITGARIDRTLTATSSGLQDGTLAATTAGPPAKEVFPFPSPFNPVEQPITFRFRLSEPKDVTLRVLDLYGHSVWRQSVSAGAGFTDVSWNGRNDDGHIVAVGVYYVLLEVDGSVESKKRFGVVK